jgi:hypothetical protein
LVVTSLLGVSQLENKKFVFTTTTLSYKDFYNTISTNRIYIVFGDISGKKIYIMLKGDSKYGMGIELDYFTGSSGVKAHRLTNGTWTDTTL